MAKPKAGKKVGKRPKGGESKGSPKRSQPNIPKKKGALGRAVNATSGVGGG